MTQYHSDRDRVSNYFDDLLAGIGHRGSSFSDIDAVTHDARGDRFLFQEFKSPDGTLSPGTRRLLAALARRAGTVWCVRRRADGRLDWCDVATRRLDVISPDEYRARFAAWWDHR